MNPSRFSSLLSYLLLIAFASMAQMGAVAPTIRAEFAVCAEGSSQLFRSTPGSQKVRQQSRDASPAGELKVVALQDAEDPEVLAAHQAHAGAIFALNRAVCALPSKPHGGRIGIYTPQFLVASVLATGPPSSEC